MEALGLMLLAQKYQKIDELQHKNIAFLFCIWIEFILIYSLYSILMSFKYGF